MTPELRTDSLWQIAEFRTFLAANVLARFATSALTVMLAFHIYEVRNNPLDLAILGFVQVLPSVTLSLHGGDVADRHVRHRLVVLTTAGLALLAGLLAFVTTADLSITAILIAAGFLSACIRAYEAPALVGLEAQVLPVNLVLRGVPVIATTARIADMAGPVAMGFFWGAFGGTATYTVIAVLFAASTLVFVVGITPKPPANKGDGSSPFVRIKEGVKYVFASQVLVGSMALDLFAVFFGGAAALLPVFATDILDVGPSGFGLLRSAMAAGAMAAAFLSLRFMPKVSAGVALHLIIAGFGLSMIVFGLSTNFYLSMGMLFIAGICDGYSMVIRHAILRLASPEHMRGRIAAVRMVFIGCSNELGAVQSGVMASALGPVRAVVAGGMMTLLVVAVVANRMPQLRRLDLTTYGPTPTPRSEPAAAAA